MQSEYFLDFGKFKASSAFSFGRGPRSTLKYIIVKELMLIQLKEV